MSLLPFLSSLCAVAESPSTCGRDSGRREDCGQGRGIDFGLPVASSSGPVTTSEIDLPSESAMLWSCGSTGGWRQGSASSSQGRAGAGGLFAGGFFMDRISGVVSEVGSNRHSHARARARSRVALVGAWIAIVVAVLAVVVLASQPWWLAPLLGAQLSKTSGREVHFDSVRVGLTPSLVPVVVMRGVRIANAPWADTSQPFAALEEAVFRFSWRRFPDRWVVSPLLLRDGEVNLALQADGLRNWRLHDPEDRGPGHYWFYALEPHRATLRFVNAGIDLHLHTSASDAVPEVSAAMPDETLVNRIDFDGAF